ncbi:hypothetical protein [Methylobacterium sp. WSM2598]|uniref:hypothetical protein n=1 Tax=Methylobacterium sp. WSM2598 TaxID=398261 RepID=UPI0012F63E50|nr:hypothetical protein [Methylobacterium sp. WSM2598]
MSETEKNKGGRPRVDATPVTVRIPPTQLASLDAWIEKQADPRPSRPDAIRKLLDKVLRKDRKKETPLSDAELIIYGERLLKNADAFYYAALLAGVPFDPGNVRAQQHRDPTDAGIAAISGPRLDCKVNGPPIVTMALATELYLKLLKVLGDKVPTRGHRLLELFLTVETLSPRAAQLIINRAMFSRGKREHFLSVLGTLSSAFEEWRYAHEHEFLITSPSFLFDLAGCTRAAISEIYPHLRSPFDLPRSADF